MLGLMFWAKQADLNFKMPLNTFYVYSGHTPLLALSLNLYFTLATQTKAIICHF
jgi:hypothetical protein